MVIGEIAAEDLLQSACRSRPRNTDWALPPDLRVARYTAVVGLQTACKLGSRGLVVPARFISAVWSRNFATATSGRFAMAVGDQLPQRRQIVRVGHLDAGRAE